MGQLAERCGVKRSTLRYYERRGLLPPPRRSPSGYRLYSPDAVSTVMFIRRAQGLGFSLEETAELLALSRSAVLSRSEARARAVEKLLEVTQKIGELRVLKRALEDLLAACEAGDTSGCPILSASEEKQEGGERP